MKIESPAFDHHKPIPKKYTCDGDDISPPLVFSDIPKNCQSIVLIMDDPDAPGGIFDHWIAWNIPPNRYVLNEGAEILNQGTNDFQQVLYRGPCPPKGNSHRYFFKMYALDTELYLPEGSTKVRIEGAIEGHVLSRAELIGTYQRP